jgi:DNA repair protein RadD
VFELRPYQREALDALDAYWAKAGTGNPLLALATATGKSLLIAWLVRDVIEHYPDVRVLVLAHALDSGHLTEGDDRIFDEVAFDYGIGRGIADGWLSPLSSKATKATIDVRNVARRGGEFVAGELERAADDEAIISASCDEIVALGAGRNCWLVFCCGVSHATHVRDALRERGVSCEAVFGETPQGERDRVIEAFRAGQIKCVVNVMVLTTGFDVPQIDLLAMLRPTLSTGLYVQMVGRGTRRAAGKQNCLVLDFAQNVYRHGPIDCVSITTTGKSNHVSAGVRVDSARAKPCPDCSELNAAATTVCFECGYLFPQPRPAARHATTADAVPVLSVATSWLPVMDVRFRKHVKWGRDRPPTLCVEYLSGLSVYSDYVAFEHRGRTRSFAERFWFALDGDDPVPLTVDEAFARCRELSRPIEISVTRDGKFWNVVERRVRHPDGSVVEVDRTYQTWTMNSRADAMTDLKHTPIKDAIPY